MKEFFKSFFSWAVALNILAMIVLFCGLLAGAYFMLGGYTRHGEKVEVPDISNKTYKVAKHELRKRGLEIVVRDTVFLKNKPADLVMEQTPEAGKTVKPGRIIYVVINAGHSPRRAIPDLVDNSSAREAKAKLEALGFKRVELQYGPGEKEWVVDLICKGKHVLPGDVLSVDERIIIIVGDGTRDLGDSVTYVDTPFYMEEEKVERISRPSEGSHEIRHDDFEYSEEEVQEEIERNLNDEIERLIRERRQQQAVDPTGIPEPM